MESRYRKKKIKNNYKIQIIICLANCLVLLSCNRSSNSFTLQEKRTVNISVVEDGDLIFRKAQGLVSALFTRSQKDKLYSHAGIIHLRNDSCFVVHAEIIDEQAEDDGDVHCEDITQFLGEAINWAIYRLDTTQTTRSKIVEVALEYKKRKTKFDKTFKSEDDNKVYCTQLLALAINKSYDRQIINYSPTTAGSGVYRVEDIYHISQISLVDKCITEE